MNFLKNNVISVMYLVLLSTLFMPWILVPDSETFTVLPVTGFRFLSDNLLMLILIFLITQLSHTEKNPKGLIYQ